MSLYDPSSPSDSYDGSDPSDQEEREERQREEFLMWRRQIGEQEFWLMCLSGLPTDDSYGAYEYDECEYEYEEYVP